MLFLLCDIITEYFIIALFYYNTVNKTTKWNLCRSIWFRYSWETLHIHFNDSGFTVESFKSFSSFIDETPQLRHHYSGWEPAMQIKTNKHSKEVQVKQMHFRKWLQSNAAALVACCWFNYREVIISQNICTKKEIWVI